MAFQTVFAPPASQVGYAGLISGGADFAANQLRASAQRRQFGLEDRRLDIADQQLLLSAAELQNRRDQSDRLTVQALQDRATQQFLAAQSVASREKMLQQSIQASREAARQKFAQEKTLLGIQLRDNIRLKRIAATSRRLELDNIQRKNMASAILQNAMQSLDSTFDLLTTNLPDTISLDAEQKQKIAKLKSDYEDGLASYLSEGGIGAEEFYALAQGINRDLQSIAPSLINPSPEDQLRMRYRVYHDESGKPTPILIDTATGKTITIPSEEQLQGDITPAERLRHKTDFIMKILEGFNVQYNAEMKAFERGDIAEPPTPPITRLLNLLYNRRGAGNLNEEGDVFRQLLNSLFDVSWNVNRGHIPVDPDYQGGAKVSGSTIRSDESAFQNRGSVGAGQTGGVSDTSSAMGRKILGFRVKTDQGEQHVPHSGDLNSIIEAYSRLPEPKVESYLDTSSISGTATTPEQIKNDLLVKELARYVPEFRNAVATYLQSKSVSEGGGPLGKKLPTLPGFDMNDPDTYPRLTREEIGALLKNIVDRKVASNTASQFRRTLSAEAARDPNIRDFVVNGLGGILKQLKSQKKTFPSDKFVVIISAINSYNELKKQGNLESAKGVLSSAVQKLREELFQEKSSAASAPASKKRESTRSGRSDLPPLGSSLVSPFTFPPPN